MIPRTLAPTLRRLARRFPVLTVTGPRQSGKTTLCRAAFPRHRYASLEVPDTREYALADPRGFLAGLGARAVIDEVQRAPALLSYLQQEVDERSAAGRFILTGSANLGFVAGVSQTLAGRTALLTLLPCSHGELRRFEKPPSDLDTVLWSGAFPAVFDRGIPPADWFSSYVATYVERDVRQLLNVTDLAAFQTFVKLCAGRIGQLLNLSGLAGDCGITHGTARAWLTVLEASHLVVRLPPWHANLGKRLIKAPKPYFLDTGLACALLGIRTPGQLASHPLRGSLFENWVLLEILKARVHRGLPPDLYFFRTRAGLEVDFLIEAGRALFAVEAKSGRTMAADFLAALRAFEALLPAGRGLRPVVVYGGESPQRRGEARVLPWEAVAASAWW